MAIPTAPYVRGNTHHSRIGSQASADRREAFRLEAEHRRRIDCAHAQGRRDASIPGNCCLPPLVYQNSPDEAQAWQAGFMQATQERAEQPKPIGGCSIALLALAFLCWLVSGFIPVPALDVDVYGLGMSYHHAPADRAAGYNSGNPGIGLGVSHPVAKHLDVTGMALVYRDSVGQTSQAAGVGLRSIIGDRDGLHATASLMAGYLCGSGYDGAIALQVVGVGWGPFHVESTYNPERQTHAAWLRVAWRVSP